MMVRTRRNIVFTVLLFCAAWVLIIMLFNNGKSQKMSSVTSPSSFEKSFTIPMAATTTGPTQDLTYPDGINAHSEPKLSRQLTSDELEEIVQAKDDAQVDETSIGTNAETPSKLAKSDLTEDIQDTSNIEEVAENEQTSGTRPIIYGVFDKESISNQSQKDVEYLLNTFVRAWYARGYYPKLVGIGRLQSHSKSGSIINNKDAKAKWIASRAALLSILGGGIMAEITTLSAPEPSDDADIDQENRVLSTLMSSGIIFPAAKAEALESLIDRILNEDEEILATISNLNQKKMLFDKDATVKIRAAVQNASVSRNIVCYGMSPEFLEKMNKDYSRLRSSKDDNSDVDAIFIDPNSSADSLAGLLKDNDPEHTELIQVLKNKILAPKNSFKNAAKILEYGFGVYFDLKKSIWDSGSGENSTGDGQDQPEIIKWASDRIEEKLQEIESVEKQIYQFVSTD